MVKYRSEEVEEKKLSPDLKSHKKKKHFKDDDENEKNTNSTECIPSPEESGSKKHKGHKKKQKHIEEEIQEEVKLKKSKKHKHPEEESTATENLQNGEEPKKKKRKHKEETVIDDKEEKQKKKKAKHQEEENTESEKAEEKPKKKKKQKHLKEENAESEKSKEVPVSKENPDKSDVEPKENNDSENPANAITNGKKKRKPRHPGREEKKKEKLRMKKLIADGIITPEPKAKIKRKRKRKAKKIEKAVTPVETTPRPKGDIPLEDEPTAECKALKFLKLWKKDREQWKFVKARQNWLVHHMYDPAKISDKKFKVLLKYMAGMKGFSRETTLKQAKSVLGAANGDTNAKIDKQISLPDKPGEIQSARAIKVIDAVKTV